MKPLRKPLQGFGQSGGPEGVPGAVFIHVLTAGHRLSEREGENPEILKNHRKEAAVFLIVVFADVNAVEPDAALRHIVQTAEKLDEGGFAGAVFADDGNPVPDQKLQIQIPDHIFLRAGIAEGHIFKFHGKAVILPFFHGKGSFIAFSARFHKPHIVAAVAGVVFGRGQRAHQLRKGRGHPDDAGGAGDHFARSDEPICGAQGGEHIDQKACERGNGPLDGLTRRGQPGFAISFHFHPADGFLRFFADQFLLLVDPQILLPFRAGENSHAVIQKIFILRPFFMETFDLLPEGKIRPVADQDHCGDQKKQQEGGGGGTEEGSEASRIPWA